MGHIPNLPLFLLQTVLFPEDQLPVRVFEARYMDMVSACLKSGRPFGVCLIRSGKEVGELAQPHAVGTLAAIERWDMPQAGVLNLLVRGERRFRIERLSRQGQIAVADVAVWEPEAPCAVPHEFSHLKRLLEQIIKEYGDGLMPLPHRFDDAAWLGMRLAQLLPVEAGAKQTWLEQRDSVERLEAIRQALETWAHEDCDTDEAR